MEELTPTYARNITYELIFTKMFHIPSFYLFIIFFNCTIKFSNSVHHVMITRRNLTKSHFHTVSGTCRGNMINDCCGFKGDSCRFLKKLHQIKQPKDICHMLSIVVNYLSTFCLCKITVRVTKEDHFLSFSI